MAEVVSLERLKAVVAAYGARPERWPIGERVELERLAVRQGGAEFLEREMALDALLERAPGARMAAGLTEIIVSSARLAPRAVPGRVVMLIPRSRPAPNYVVRAIEGALLAASLAGGLWLGTAGLADRWLPVETSVASLGASGVTVDEVNFLVALDATEVSR